MASAIDVFREQREAADQVHERLTEISQLVGQLRQQVDALAMNEELRKVLRQEQDWLTSAQLAVSEVRAFREAEMARFWPDVVERWALALVLALAAAGAAGASYAWFTKPYTAEIADLRSRVAFGDFIEHRMLTMTPAERRQLDALMKWNPQPVTLNPDARKSAKPTPHNPGNHDRDEDSKQREVGRTGRPTTLLHPRT
jgi:hypothetical protein